MAQDNSINSLPTYIINRKKDAERRQVMSDRLEDMGLNYKFFEAVDGHAFNAHESELYDGGRRRRYFGRDLTVGEIGCLLSHRAIYEMMVEKKTSRALILEDDTIFDTDFPVVLQAVLNISVEWDLVRFLNSKKILKSSHRVINKDVGGYALYQIQATPGGAFAYILTLKAAKELLLHTQKNWLPIDIWHGWVWKTNLKVLSMLPSPVRADFDISSTIGDLRFDKTIQTKGFERVVFPFHRFWFKIYSSVCKRYAYQFMRPWR